jgi:type IV pilus assembly protein PilC
MLRIPIIGTLVAQYEIVLFIKTYSMLLASGIPVITALNLVGDSISNTLYAKSIKEATKEVEKGVSLASALSKYQYIPSILWRSIAIGEETGKTETILDKIGRYFEQQVDDKVSNLTRLLEPILLIVLGSIVGFIAVAIYLPIYSFSSVIH